MTPAAARETMTKDAAPDSARSLPLSQVIELVKQNPGKTSRELADLAGKDRFAMARRLPEVAQGVDAAVMKGEARVCRITSSRALTWWPNA